MVIPQQQGTSEMINRKRFAILLPDQRIFIRLQPSDLASPLMGFLRAVFPEGRLHREIQIPLLQGGTLPDRKPIQTDPGISVAPQIAIGPVIVTGLAACMAATSPVSTSTGMENV